MLKQLVEALFLHGRIKTTLARAKETRPLAEHMVTLAKKGSLHHRRQALSFIPRNDVVHRLFDHIVEWYTDRSGGYTRIIKMGPRMGDAAPMAFLELVDWIPGEKLAGQHTKVVKSETGEETPDGKGEKDKKAKEEKKAKAKKKEEKKVKAVSVKPVKKKVSRDAEKDKKISERQAEKEKLKKERTAAREKTKKTKLEKKAQSATKAKKAGAKPRVKKVKKAKKAKKK